MSEPAYLRRVRRWARAERGPARRDVATIPPPRPETAARVDGFFEVEDLLFSEEYFVPVPPERRPRRPEVPWRVRFERWVAQGATRRRDWAMFAHDLEAAGLDPEEAERRAFLALEGAA